MSPVEQAGVIRPLRGSFKVGKFANAMQHELSANQYKGDWADRGTEVWELFYHALKLAYALEAGIDKPGILELAADVGNEAMFLADNASAIDAGSTEEPTVFYTDDHEGLGKASQALHVFIDAHIKHTAEFHSATRWQRIKWRLRDAAKGRP